jgi:CheY-like chemotaxis protein
MAKALNSLETILVVDDNASVLRTVSTILAGAGYVVLNARCGEDALKLGARQRNNGEVTIGADRYFDLR